MLDHDVDAAVDAFRISSANALEAGFDGIELHAAHAYLLEQFRARQRVAETLWPEARPGCLARASRTVARFRTGSPRPSCEDERPTGVSLPANGCDLAMSPKEFARPGCVLVLVTNLVPFSLDIGSSETMHANGLGGDDAITVGEVGSYSVTAAGGPGNDTLTGGSSETFLSGSGNDTITPGGGLDVVSGDEGDDHVNVRDNTADVSRGGDGNDTVIADTANLDILEGFETVDRTPVDTPAPVDTSTRPVTITGGTMKVNKGTASIKVSCPTTSPGNCTGSLALRTTKRINLARLKVVLQLGNARYNLAPGASTTLKVKLAKGSQRLADRKATSRFSQSPRRAPRASSHRARSASRSRCTRRRRGSRHPLPRTRAASPPTREARPTGPPGRTPAAHNLPRHVN